MTAACGLVQERKQYTHDMFYARLLYASFCFNTPYQLRSPIFGFTPFDWLFSITLTPYLWWEYIFFIYALLIHAHFFRNANTVKNKGWVYDYLVMRTPFDTRQRLSISWRCRYKRRGCGESSATHRPNKQHYIET
jgi:hypothetical protein